MDFLTGNITLALARRVLSMDEAINLSGTNVNYRRQLGFTSWTMTDLGAAVCASFSQGTPASGTKQTCRRPVRMSASEGSADIVNCQRSN